ncbi:CocE/NonD family hydrolase C-terminal non-catalytic domain-containing protein [Actinocorallia aurantiaca]|uniref:CocE/NonD family hydrolase C-terminal non-catalytic domain-containing protein n=1 Tax=Actinocorallia aurantiaca TaxID=46204 RepID=UPI003CD0C0EC
MRETPFSWRNATPGKPFALDLTLPDTAYDLAPGHRVGLALTTHDVLFRSENADDAPITFSSSPTDPAFIEVPIR